MKIAVCYIAVTNGPLTEDYSARFVTTFHEYPPGIDCDVLVICNGGPLPTTTTILFSDMNARMFPRSNEGWDIGGYIEAASKAVTNYDMMLCCGESVYFHRPGWLKRLVQAWEKYGPGMYGSLSSNLVRGHLNTTGFCCPPKELLRYPKAVSTREDRYEFEHGKESLWRRMAFRGLPVRLVTWDGDWEPRGWRCPNNILWRGNQTNCLIWCQHTDRYEKANVTTKMKWARGADQPFK